MAKVRLRSEVSQDAEVSIVRFWSSFAEAASIPLALCDENWAIREANTRFMAELPGIGTGSRLSEYLEKTVDPFAGQRLERALRAERGSIEAVVLSTQSGRRHRILVSPVVVGQAAFRQVSLEPTVSGSEFWNRGMGGLDAAEQMPIGGLVAVVPDPIFIWDFHNERIRYWSESAERSYGYSAEQALGQHARELLNTETSTNFESILAELRQNGRWSGEMVQRAKDGSVVVADTHMALLDQAGHEFVVQANSDVTSRREAEQALHFHFELNRSITNQAVDPIFVVGGKGEIIFANPEVAVVFGWQPSELIGQSFHDTLHHHTPEMGEFPRPMCPLLHAQQAGQELRGLELVFFHRDGSPVPVSCSNTPLRFKGDEIGSVVIVRDISKLKQFELALGKSEERLRLALEASHIGIWDLPLPGSRLTLDDNCRTAFGLLDEGTLSVSGWLRKIHPEDRKRTKAIIREALQPSGARRFTIECRVLGRSEKRHGYLLISGQALLEGDTPLRVIGTVQDITTSKRAELALRQANQDLEQFAYAAAHDLQEPLRNLMNLHGLQRRTKEHAGSYSDDLFQAGTAEAQRMHEMVRDLLLFSEAGQQTAPVTQRVDANTVLADVLRVLGTAIREAGAEVYAETLPMLKVRPSHLMQLLQNLIGNSLKYRDRSRVLTIRIEARRRGGNWVISITDNGIGFDPIYAQRIFGVFKRLHGHSEYPGSGIGLAICSRIVALYGGQIWATSQLGAGATFSFTLPVSVE